MVEAVRPKTQEATRKVSLNMPAVNRDVSDDVVSDRSLLRKMQCMRICAGNLDQIQAKEAELRKTEGMTTLELE